MDLLDLFVKIGVKDEVSDKVGGVGDTVKNVLGGAAAIGTAALTAASAAAGALAKSAVDSYADYEQLAGGVQKLFGEHAQAAVMSYAENAYKTAGLTANQYMETVTGFSASLINGLGGATGKAAEMANVAITDMSDNVNTFGSSMESVQNAYAGFAKGNFTMLDNLKLGYGGTQEEMVRLINDSGILNEKIKSMDGISFAQIISAIHEVQENQNIAGTTANEAASTISGSTEMMKSAWGNLVTGIADENANFDVLITNFVDSVGSVAENIIPRIQIALSGVGEMIQGLAPVIIEAVPGLIENTLPSLLEAATSLAATICDTMNESLPGLIETTLPSLIETAISLVATIGEAMNEALPSLLDVGLNAIMTLCTGLAEALPNLIPAAVETILNLVLYLIENVDKLVDSAIAIITALAEGVIKALPILIERAPEIISKFVLKLIELAPELLKAAFAIIEMLVKGIIENWPKIILAAIETVTKFIDGLTQKIKDLPMKGAEMVEAVKNGLKEKIEDAKQWGKDLIDNFISGIKQKWDDLKDSVLEIADTVSDFLHFSEPEKGPLANFHTFAPDMMDLFSQGIRDNMWKVEEAMGGLPAISVNNESMAGVGVIHNVIEIGGKPLLEFVNSGLGGML